MSDLLTREQAAAQALEVAHGYARGSHASETLRAYATDWSAFEAWTLEVGLCAMPAEPGTVAAYLASIAPNVSRSLLHRRLAAIGHQHRAHGREWHAGHPAVRKTLQGIYRAHASTKRPAAALTSPDLRRLVDACGPDLVGTRDRAMLLIGFAGALRRSEIVGIDVDHIHTREGGIALHIPRSKGDKAGDGVDLGIAEGKHAETCPVLALRAWLAQSGVLVGPVFRAIDRWGVLAADRLGADGVRRVLLRRSREAGLEAPAGDRLSPHGLRSGFITEAYLAGARDEVIMDHSRHRDLKTMRGYVRRAKLVTDSAVRLLDI